MKTCEFTWTGYPHEGCAEFGPPDEFHCREKAEWKFDFENPVPMYDEGPIETVFFCTFHGTTALLFEDIVDIAKMRGDEQDDERESSACPKCGDAPTTLSPFKDERQCRACGHRWELESPAFDPDRDILEREDPWPL